MPLLTPFKLHLAPPQSNFCLLPCHQDSLLCHRNSLLCHRNSLETIIEVEKLATNITDLERWPTNLLQALRSPWCLNIWFFGVLDHELGMSRLQILSPLSEVPSKLPSVFECGWHNGFLNLLHFRWWESQRSVPAYSTVLGDGFPILTLISSALGIAVFVLLEKICFDSIPSRTIPVNLGWSMWFNSEKCLHATLEPILDLFFLHKKFSVYSI